jgi:glycosyltransferase involved in cell wall biosynthesis
MRPLMILSSLADGGAESVSVAFLRRCAARGMGLPLCTLTARRDGALAREAAETGLTRHDLGALRLLDPRAAWRLVRLVRGGSFDLVHAHGQDAAILAVATRPLHGARVVVTRHVIDEPSRTRRERWRAGAALAALARADARVTVSQAAASRLAELLGPRHSDIRVIRNGVDLERFAPGSRREAARTALGLEPDDLAMLALAVLREGKGHDVLLGAMPGVLAEVPRARLLVAGAGETEPALRALAAPLGKAVDFLGARADAPDLLAASDVVVLASLAEALPTALMEAAAAGRPCVATRVGGVPEIVEDGVTGLLVPPGDSAALARALIRLAREAALRVGMGRAARERAEAQFSLDAQVERTWELWRDVARRGGA